MVIDDTPDHVDFDSAGTIMRVARKDIESMTPPVSSMPPMNFMLSSGEIRDVVAWLSEQKRKVAQPTNLNLKKHWASSLDVDGKKVTTGKMPAIPDRLEAYPPAIHAR